MISACSRLLKICGAFLTAVFLSLIFYAVFSRYVFNRPINYSDELAALLFVTCAFIGILCSALDNDHIEINIATSKMKMGWRCLCKRLSAVICVMFFSFFAYQSYIFAEFSRQIGALTEGAALPISYWMYVMPAASAMGAITYAYRIFSPPKFAPTTEDNYDRSAKN